MASEADLLKVLWRDMAVDEVAQSIAVNGFFEHEPIYVEPRGDRYTVIEGNRRVAAVKLLLSAAARKGAGATDMPALPERSLEKLRELPAIVTTRKRVWEFVGFKHINGAQPWGSYAKATYIAWVHNVLDVPLDEIASSIGDKHSTVAKLYDGLMLLQQAETERLFAKEDRSKAKLAFSHLYTGIQYSGFRKFLGLPKESGPLRSRNPVPKSKLKNLGDLMLWLYGSKKQNKQPLVRSQNPDLKILDTVLQEPQGVISLRRGLPLDVSLEIARGDESVFKEALLMAKQALQRAQGTAVTGFQGSKDDMETAEDVLLIAQKLVADMKERRLRRRESRA